VSGGRRSVCRSDEWSAACDTSIRPPRPTTGTTTPLSNLPLMLFDAHVYELTPAQPLSFDCLDCGIDTFGNRRVVRRSRRRLVNPRSRPGTACSALASRTGLGRPLCRRDFTAWPVNEHVRGGRWSTSFPWHRGRGRRRHHGRRGARVEQLAELPDSRALRVRIQRCYTPGRRGVRSRRSPLSQSSA
jgi:hypothetical protein